MIDKNVFWTKETPQMLGAFKQAQSTFKYFWRELYWERRRIVPALDFAFIKVAFHQEKLLRGMLTEFMWVRVLAFNGFVIKGVLDNEPQKLTNIKLGEEIDIPLDEICDWLFSCRRKAYGGFTVHVLRAEMSEQDRQQHDAAWGLDFGASDDITLVYEQKEHPENLIEHPMSINMKEKLADFLEKHPDELVKKDDLGYTFLHNEAIAGNRGCIEVLLKKGADVKAKTNAGHTALDLAKKLEWDHIISILQDAGQN